MAIFLKVLGATQNVKKTSMIEVRSIRMLHLQSILVITISGGPYQNVHLNRNIVINVNIYLINLSFRTTSMVFAHLSRDFARHCLTLY